MSSTHYSISFLYATWQVTCLLWQVYLGHAQTVHPGPSLPLLHKRERGARAGQKCNPPWTMENPSLNINMIWMKSSHGFNPVCYLELVSHRDHYPIPSNVKWFRCSSSRRNLIQLTKSFPPEKRHTNQIQTIMTMTIKLTLPFNTVS